MKWIVFVVGLLTAVFGVWWSWDGYNIVLVERGWAKHIAGAVIFGAGLLTMALAALMHKVQQLAAVMAEMRQAPRAYAPPAYAPQDSRAPVEEREDEPAVVVPACADGGFSRRAPHGRRSRRRGGLAAARAAGKGRGRRHARRCGRGARG